MFGSTASNRKRRLSDTKIQLDSDKVKVDYRRESLYVEWCDEDGRKKKRWKKPSKWDADNISKAEERLLEWLGKSTHEHDNDHIKSEDAEDANIADEKSAQAASE